jgi:hypothetical protein
VSLPRHLGPPDPGSGRGPFGEKAFRGALIVCAVLVVIGLPLVVATGGTARAIGTVLLALGVLGLVVGGGGLLAERLLQRRPPPPADVRRGNGRGRFSSDRRR